MDGVFDDIWSQHKTYVRRVLIGLSRDLDLADDLAQEVYLRASRGFEGFRGGDVRAWLGAIARNAYRDHFRRKYARFEVPLDDAANHVSQATVGCSYDLLLIDIRDAVDHLEPSLKTALVMKHSGGCTYKEIADAQGCPVGTAKWRVSEALSRLRDNLGAPPKEAVAVKCADISGALLLDYIDGTLSARKKQAIRRHLEQCPECAARLREIARVLHSLDEAEGEYKTSCVVEIDRAGNTTGYFWMSIPNATDDPMTTISLRHDGLEYMTVQGEEVILELLPGEADEDGMRAYKADLPIAIPLGEQMRMHVVVKHPPGPGRVVRLDDRLWRFGPGKLTLTEELLYEVAVRLPECSAVLSATPEGSEVKGSTVRWHGALPPNGCFEFSVEYDTGR